MELYPFQTKGSAFLEKHKYVLLGDEMGLGKSMQAIDALPHHNAKLIVCPAMLRNTWANEIAKYCKHRDWAPKIEICRGIRHKFQRGGDRIVIMSYELLRIFPKDIYPRAIIFDECHYLKNLSAARTQKAHELVKDLKPKYLFLLSGTPIKNNCTEFYSALKLLSYCPTKENGLAVTEKSQYAFNLKFSHPSSRTIYTPQGKAIEVTEFKGIRNKDKLKEYLQHKYLRRKADKVLDLPEIIDKEIEVNEKPKAHHKDLVTAYESYVEGNGEREHVMAIKIRNALEKVAATVSYTLDLMDTGEKLIVFTDHLEPAKQIEDILNTKKSNGRVIARIDGSVPGIKREGIVEDFQAGKIDVLVLTIQSCKEGLTLTRARNIIFNDISWSYVDLQQARKRIHRVGQDRNCVIHYILVSETDTWLKRKVMEKKRNLEEIL